MPSHWITEYGYWAVLLGTLFEGETIVILAGYAAHRGYLSPVLVAVAAFAGSLSGDQLAYVLGLRFHSLVSSQRNLRARRIAQVKTWFERRSVLVMLGFRFVYGIRNVTPFAIGTMKVPARRFAPLNALGALLWAPLFTWLGYAFGQAVSLVFDRVREYEMFVMVSILTIGVAVSIVHQTRTRLRERRHLRDQRD